MVMIVDDEDEETVVGLGLKLQLIDAVQRLGVGYHYEIEIEESLEKIHGLGEEFLTHEKTDLCHAALWFRLLRQQGLHVTPDMFTKFMDNDDEEKLKESLASDEQGLLSLYEAAHVAVHGEDILDKALVFATKNLNSILTTKCTPQFQKQVKFSLSLPLWKCVPRTLTRHYIDFYSEDHGFINNEKLLRFAKLDFNKLQKCHQRELREITEWWGGLQVPTKFRYARDRVVECYYWIYAVYFEPRYHSARIILTKIISMLSLLDDTYDNFGTYDEVEILTTVIQRLDPSPLESSLPNEMKNMYRVIIDLYDEIGIELSKSGPTFAVDYAKEELKKLCRSYLAEIRWRTKGHVPTLEEYKKEAYVTSAFPILCTSAFVGMGAEIATTEAFDWVTNEPKMVKAASVICRLQNDIVSHKFEQNRKHAASAVECYMKEHDAPEEAAVEFLRKEISEAWKDIAEECRRPTPLPVALMDRVLNFARSISVIYENGDGYTDSHLLKAHIASLFAHPV
ncbi:unnamed protein product [Linum trigynum]|uniref:Uncharacterized protein n=1 Tax=Linum trigynum TaxID=586398 RepID=A0AAV2EKP8_9ROSI